MIIHIFAKPNAKQTKLIGKDDRGLIIALKARPQNGEANDELIRFLAELYDVPKSQIILKRGNTAKYKVVEIKM